MPTNDKNIKKLRHLWLKHKNLPIKPNDGLFFKKINLDLLNTVSILHGHPPIGLEVQISLNIGCNAKCIMCDGRKYNPSACFTYASVLKLVEHLDNETVSSIKFLGGEPLLDRYGLLKVIKKCQKKKIETIIYTNGHFLNEDFLDKLIQNGISEIAISLHAVGEKHNSIMGIRGLFQRIEKNLIYLKKTYPSFKILIATVVMKANFKEILPLANIIEKYGIYDWSLIKLENFNKNYKALLVKDKEMERLFFLLKRLKPNINMHLSKCGEIKMDKNNKCSYLLHKININGEGKIIPCNKSDGNNFFLRGHIKELYQNPEFRNYLIDKIRTCDDCVIKNG